jgi:hypothetical protein
VGLGGGFILIPILNLALGFPIKDAVFFSLCSVFFLSILQNLMNKDLIHDNRKLLIPLSLYAVVGSVVAAWIGARSSDAVLSISFGIFLVIAGMAFARSSDQLLARVPAHIRSRTSHGLMVFAGVTSGFFGIGGGIITVPVLHFLHLKNMQDSSKLSFFVQFFATGTGLLVYYHSRRDILYQLSPTILGFLLLGSLIGFILSRRVKLKDQKLKKIFAVLIVLVGLWKLVSLLIH